MSVDTLLIRADASVATGTGHVMRCLALAQAWQDVGGRAAFAMAEVTSALRTRLAWESCEVFSISSPVGSAEDASQTIARASELHCEWIVVDGYHFSASYQQALKAAGFKIVFLDDYGHAQHYSAQLVVNQNVYASETLYANRDPHSLLLLGPRYCLLRREFLAWRDWKREVPQVGRRLLVTMGGSDPENLTARAMDALALVEIEDLEAIVVVGGSSPHSELQEGKAQGRKKISVCRDVSNMAELMAWADAAVSSAGTTVLELAFMGVPTILVTVADNQRANAGACEKLELALNLGDFSDVSPTQLAAELEALITDPERQMRMTCIARALVDGRGAERVAARLIAESRRDWNG